MQNPPFTPISFAQYLDNTSTLSNTDTDKIPSYKTLWLLYKWGVEKCKRSGIFSHMVTVAATI